MKDKKLQVFVSSTYTDLIEERQAAVEAILSSGNIPAGMELFSAGDESQMTVIERWIDESDVYLLILGGRYGSIDSKTGKSYTHLEYEYALRRNKPYFAVVISEKALDEKVAKEGRKVLEQDNSKELKDFRAVVLKNLVKIWNDKKDIELAIHKTLSDFSYSKELIGWVRGDNAVNTGILAEEIARLAKENSELRSRIEITNSVDNALYSGLNYMQLASLLKNQTIELFHDLFNFLLSYGDELISGMYFNKNRRNDKEKMEVDNLKKLEFYKIVQIRESPFNDDVFKFTDDGHNFYLKALAFALNDNK